MTSNSSVPSGVEIDFNLVPVLVVGGPSVTIVRCVLLASCAVSNGVPLVRGAISVVLPVGAGDVASGSLGIVKGRRIGGTVGILRIAVGAGVVVTSVVVIVEGGARPSFVSVFLGGF